MKIYYYVSGHGFGHISRTSEILKKLLLQDFIEEIWVVSPRSEFLDFTHHKLKLRSETLDVGVIQKDSLSIDLTSTKQKLISFEKEKNNLIKTESAFIKDKKLSIVLTDSGSLPISIAMEANIPSIFIGNFTWDFIYRNYKSSDVYFGEIADLIEVEYGFATEALTLPFQCPMPSFLEINQIGLVGRKPTKSKKECRKQFGFLDNVQYILLSFGAYGLEGTNLKTDQLQSNIQLVAHGVPGLENKDILSPNVDHYPNLVAAADFVCTKPGYGILSECYYAQTPILYTDRGDFSEYPYLVSALEKYFIASYMDRSEIIACAFERVISAMKQYDQMTNRSQVLLDGETDVVNHLLEYI
ncbi:glycosyl transferase [Leptospira sp. 96542]|nr:glycosyl transferase [Leptospira sp. 96542]